MSGFGDVAQLVRACGSYPQSPGFNSLRRYQDHTMPPVQGGFLFQVQSSSSNY